MRIYPCRPRPNLTKFGSHSLWASCTKVFTLFSDIDTQMYVLFGKKTLRKWNISFQKMFWSSSGISLEIL